MGDYLNGYLLAIFAILTGTKWSTTLILLALPIIDAIFVIFIRFRDHPEVRKNPLKILNISDKNHLHHRLLAAGYGHKTVTLIEVCIMVIVCTIAITLSSTRQEIAALAIGWTVILVVFTIIYFIKKRKDKNEKMRKFIDTKLAKEAKKDAIVKVIFKDEEGKDEKFIY